ncbi:hypothetical protein, partial [Paramagnetospirillum marisnigri]|uniref:hypothetical protein n=1 Tax=Paramagnetospirillum marisnigri TaxID=1285242 RepID=UPI001C12C3D7
QPDQSGQARRRSNGDCAVTPIQGTRSMRAGEMRKIAVCLRDKKPLLMVLFVVAFIMKFQILQIYLRT